MGEFADDVHEALRDALATRDATRDWRTEWYVRQTPADVAGIPETNDASLVLVEVEMRRADPANNPVKLARYASEGVFDRSVRLVQVFSDYYDLDGGGVSSKRENAVFVGRLAAAEFDSLEYEAVDLDVAPPVRGDDRPDDWRGAVDGVADEVVDPQ